MIPIEPRPEPLDFNAKVRTPGKKFLASTPNPTAKQFQANAFWKETILDLRVAYSNICAYSCFYMPTGHTIDHFQPKSSHPEQAYEWHNFRLCRHRLNQYKGDSQDILDPFSIQAGWFTMDVPSCLIRPNTNLPKETRDAIANTIAILKLNDDDDIVQERCDIMVSFACGDVTLTYLEKRYPFLASEIRRQNLQQTAVNIFKQWDY